MLKNRTIDDALAEARNRYAERRPKSRDMDARAKKVLPGGNTRTILYFGPFPFRVVRGEGSRLFDADGHTYVNLLGEYTAGIYGASNPEIRKALIEAIDNGLNYGAHNRYELELAEIVCQRFPAIERVRFTNSGTEANLLAISTARVVTKRPEVMAMRGGYHGGVFFFAGGGSPINAPFPYRMASYNDIEGTKRLIEENGDKLACVIVEAMMGSSGCIPADPKFLAMLRETTKKTGAILILDEVMTSRFGTGGAQKLFCLTPDLVTLGKYIGGGASFGAFGGRADIMELFNPASPNAIPHAGTFNNNVLSMAAGIAGMSKVFTPAAAEALHARGDRLRSGINAVAERRKARLQATGIGSLMSIHTTRTPVRTPADALTSDDKLKEVLFLELLEAGYYMARRGFIALSLAVSDAEIEGFLAALDGTVTDNAGLFA
ncbi:MAG: aminotransferase class III-fold pyridoxal phosphate-dependent enzyme [Bauldia sp.]|nr:MAG: aminotransferase class III-fold pyridoxal phosphate-dependent enzyme [Bauldia sp.]